MDEKKRVKVLHVSTTVAGGLGQSLLILLKHLDKGRFDVSVAFSPGYPLDGAFEREGIRSFRIRMSRGLNLFSSLIGFFQMFRLFRREKFDIVHAHGSIAGVLARVAAKMAGVPAARICEPEARQPLGENGLPVGREGARSFDRPRYRGLRFGEKGMARPENQILEGIYQEAC